MSTGPELDFLVTWGREFADAISDVTEACTQDAYEVYWMAFEAEPDIETLRKLTAEDVVRLREAARENFETTDIQNAHIQQAVQRTVLHWVD